MSQLAPIMLTAEQFAQLPTKDYIDDRLKDFATKDYLDKNFATKDYLDKNFATKDDLKNFATKDDFKNFATKDDFKKLSTRMEERFDLLDYKIDTNVAQSHKDLNTAIFNHEIRIKKLESKYI